MKGKISILSTNAIGGVRHAAPAKTYHEVQIGDIVRDSYGEEFFVTQRDAYYHSTRWDGPLPVVKPLRAFKD